MAPHRPYPNPASTISVVVLCPAGSASTCARGAGVGGLGGAVLLLLPMWLRVTAGMPPARRRRRPVGPSRSLVGGRAFAGPPLDVRGCAYVQWCERPAPLGGRLSQHNRAAG
jgi:hypothetical protein